MNTKLNILTAAILAGFGASAIAAPPPPPAPVPAPLAKLNVSIATNPAEQAAFALYEGVLQQAEAAIVAKSCSGLAGSYKLDAFADGLETNENFVKVTSPGSTFTLEAKVAKPDKFRGQKIRVTGGGSFNGLALKDYKGKFYFNAPSTIMTGDATTNAQGNLIAGKVIKDFYIDGIDPDTGLYRVTDYGLQAVLKASSPKAKFENLSINDDNETSYYYPLQKYWQRSRTLRSNGVEGLTLFVKDRLVGPTPCRIVIYTHGENQEGFFQQTGTLSITASKLPTSPVAWPF